jgi:hypothetical protein
MQYFDENMEHFHTAVFGSFLEIEPQTVAALTSEAVRGVLAFSPDFRMVYNHVHGVPASTAGRFLVRGSSTTTFKTGSCLGGLI